MNSRLRLQLIPAFPFAYYNLAQVFSAQKRYDSAIYYLRQGLAASPTASLAADMNLALAVAYSENNNYSEAIPLFQALVAAHPKSPELRFNLATATRTTSNTRKQLGNIRRICGSIRRTISPGCRWPRPT